MEPSWFSRSLVISLLILSCFHHVSGVTTGDKYCNTYVCVSVTLRDNSPAEVIVATTQTSVGWIGVGVNSVLMGFADLTAYWQNPDGTLTISRRQAKTHIMPPPMQDQSAYTYITTNGTTTISAASPLLWQYLRPVALPESSLVKQPMDFIWAFSNANVTSSSPMADIAQHIVQGTFKLDLSKVVDGGGGPLPTPVPTTTASVPKGATQTSAASDTPQTTFNPFANQTITPTRVLTNLDIMVISHGSMLFTAMFILVPIAIFLARYKREMQHWVRAHYIIQIIALAVALGGGFIGYLQSYGVHLKSTHQIIGVTVLGAFCVQVLLGFLIHFLYDPERVRRPLRNVLHKLLGRAVFLLAISATPLGLRDYLAPKPFVIIYWLWIGCLVVFFFFYEIARRGAKKLEKKTNDLGWKQEQTRYEELHELNLH